MLRFFHQPTYQSPESSVPEDLSESAGVTARADAPDCDLSLDELRLLATPASLDNLVEKKQFHILSAMVRYQLITAVMLERPAEKISVAHWLISSGQYFLVEAMLNQKLVTQAHLNEKSWWGNAVCEMIVREGWSLLNRLMQEKLIPLAACFKDGENVKDAKGQRTHALGLIAESESKEGQACAHALNQYVYENVSTLIANQETKTIDDWLVWFVKRKPLLVLTQVIDYMIQSESDMEKKMHKAWFYPAVARSHPDKSVIKANQAFQVKLMFKVIETIARLAPDAQVLDELLRILQSDPPPYYVRDTLLKDKVLIKQTEDLVITERASRKPIVTARLGG